MDDILLSHPKKDKVEQILEETIQQLTSYGFVIAPEKIQRNKLLSYLGQWIHDDYMYTQKVSIRRDKLKTLNDFQILLGNINRIKPYLKVTTGTLSPLFAILQGDSDPKSKRQLTPEALAALKIVEEALNIAKLTQLDYSKIWSLLIFASEYTPTACLWQKGISEWIHLPHTQSKMLADYPFMCSLLIIK